jgi:hypothetical protein
MMNWKELGRKRSWNNRSTSPVYPCSDRRKRQKNLSVSIDNVPAEIRTKYPPIKCLDRYRYINLLRVIRFYTHIAIFHNRYVGLLAELFPSYSDTIFRDRCVLDLSNSCSHVFIFRDGYVVHFPIYFFIITTLLFCTHLTAFSFYT